MHRVNEIMSHAAYGRSGRSSLARIKAAFANLRCCSISSPRLGRSLGIGWSPSPSAMLEQDEHMFGSREKLASLDMASPQQMQMVGLMGGYYCLSVSVLQEKRLKTYPQVMENNWLV